MKLSHSIHETESQENNDLDFENILPQNDDYGDVGAIPISAVPAFSRNLDVTQIDKPSLSFNTERTSASKRSRNTTHRVRKHQSMIVDTEELNNEAKNQIIANNLYGEEHGEKIDEILADDSMTQRRKEDILFNMLDEYNYTIDESQFDE